MEKIVYVYNYQGVITITRNSEGGWHCIYSIKKVFDYLNRNGKKYHLSRQIDFFDVGEIVGYKLYELFEYCKKSYGDVGKVVVKFEMIDNLTPAIKEIQKQLISPLQKEKEAEEEYG